jgi:hypothetical protein
LQASPPEGFGAAPTDILQSFFPTMVEVSDRTDYIETA